MKIEIYQIGKVLPLTEERKKQLKKRAIEAWNRRADNA